MASKPTAIVFIDGFNLYHRRLTKNNHLKWLNVVALSERLLPDFEVTAVEYFTAELAYKMVENPEAVIRQASYVRALRTLPKLTVRLGKFRADLRWLLIHPSKRADYPGITRAIPVLKLEEKGSDVNLASRMVAASLTDQADVVVLLTNDSDQAGQMRMLTNEYGKAVGLITPVLDRKRSAKELRSLQLTVLKGITDEDLLACQLPESIRDKNGTVHKPAAWS